MKATLRVLISASFAWVLLAVPGQAAAEGLRLDNFWSDGPVSVFLYRAAHHGLEPDEHYARHDLRPGQVIDVAVDGRETVWADVRVMHADGRRWLMCSQSCGYRNAFAVHPGQTIEITYESNEGYADSSTGMRCRVLEANALNR